MFFSVVPPLLRFSVFCRFLRILRLGSHRENVE